MHSRIFCIRKVAEKSRDLPSAKWVIPRIGIMDVDPDGDRFSYFSDDTEDITPDYWEDELSELARFSPFLFKRIDGYYYIKLDPKLTAEYAAEIADILISQVKPMEDDKDTEHMASEIASRFAVIKKLLSDEFGFHIIEMNPDDPDERYGIYYTLNQFIFQFINTVNKPTIYRVEGMIDYHF